MEIAKTSPGPVAVGFTCERHATFEYESQYTGEKERSVSAVMQLRVTEFVPSERLAYERKIRGTPLATDLLAFEVKPTINGTRTTLRGYESTPRWPWTLSPFWPVLKLGASWALGRYLRRIKERVESTKS
jgi:hypothetical protein